MKCLFGCGTSSLERSRGRSFLAVPGLLVHAVDVGLEVRLHDLPLELEGRRDEAALGRPRLRREGQRHRQLERLQPCNGQEGRTLVKSGLGTGKGCKILHLSIAKGCEKINKNTNSSSEFRMSK